MLDWITKLVCANVYWFQSAVAHYAVPMTHPRPNPLFVSCLARETCSLYQLCLYCIYVIDVTENTKAPKLNVAVCC